MNNGKDKRYLPPCYMKIKGYCTDIKCGENNLIEESGVKRFCKNYHHNEVSTWRSDQSPIVTPRGRLIILTYD